MKAKKLLFVFVIFLGIFSIMLVSAGFFGNVWNKITGNSIEGLDMTPRIAIWAEKATQHTENGVWVTDPEGLAYAVIAPDLNTEEYRLAFCRKYYGKEILSTREYKKETITTWMSRWNRDGPYSSTNHITYECVKSSSSENDKLNISDDKLCSFNCANLGFECGGPMICGNSGLCGDCPSGQYCNALFKCVSISGSTNNNTGGLINNQTIYCKDTCASLGYQCGIQNICGNLIDCGNCSSDSLCLPRGKCVLFEFENKTLNNFSNESLSNLTEYKEILNHTQNFSRGGEGDFCKDTCASLGYQCGDQEVCGEIVNCGSCPVGVDCNFIGMCEMEPCESGCYFNGKCLSVGDRRNKIYCSSEFDFIDQSEKEEFCQFDYECKSNYCSQGVCMSKGFFGRILEFFKY